ncbi:hypothetical protein FDENT_5205 [Fusarium denticulatum]|uniref:Uncharacterized protein n=1 Tax=Fusarium denticulatum TaxID=48507 RepID=A0A8H5UHK2_9HYPO|nr:hypothetical protein FDENT_5205 [Fusarium denticulatum]
MSSSPRISPFITVSYILLTCSLIFIYTVDPFYFHFFTFSFTLTVVFRQILAIVFAVRNGRAYGTPHRPPPRGASAQGRIWGHTFSIELCRLMTHPVFEMGGTNLTLILQYAVICRTDDRRPWKMPPIPDVNPLKQLRGVMQSCSGPLSTPISDVFASHCTNESPPRGVDTRVQEQNDAIKTYLTDPRHLIFMMLHLAEVVQDSPQTEGPYITTERGFDVYSVTTLDLENIRKAIGAMERHYGEGNEGTGADDATLFHVPMDLIFSRYVMKSRLENVAPNDSDELSDLIVAGSMKREREIFDTTLGRHRQ